MKRLVSCSLAVFTCICMIVATERRAYGYVNPGDGLLALQSIASVAAATGYFLRRRIAGLFSRDTAKTPEKTTVLPIDAHKPGSRNAA